MREAKGKPGNWNATVVPGDEVLACIHQRFCGPATNKGEIAYSEHSSMFAYKIDIAKNLAHVEKIISDGKAIITTDKAKIDNLRKITEIPRDKYVAIMEIYEAKFVHNDEIKLRGKIIERLK